MDAERTQPRSKPHTAEAGIGRLTLLGDSGVYIIGIGDEEPEAILSPDAHRQRSPEDESMVADVFAKAQERSDQILHKLECLESRLVHQSGIRTSV